ncbi:E3 ubiquitin-protein ligase ubr1 [Mitosporidium daphniae]
MSIVHYLILSDPLLWKELRSTLKTFLMNSMLKFYYFKLKLGICFTECYPTVLKSFLSQDIEAEYSIIFFSVQLYTVPSIVLELLKSHNLFVKILSCSINGFKEAYVDSTFTFTSPFIKNRRYFHPFQDLRYIIDDSRYEDLGEPQKPEIIKLLLQFFNLFSEMNINVHSIEEHVEYENDSWIHAFNISLQCAKFAQELQKYFVSSFEVGCQVLGLIMQQADGVLCFSRQNSSSNAVLPIGGSFSFHHPVQWFISNILRSTRKLSGTFPPELMCKLLTFLPNIVIPCIQLQAYLGQIRSNLWIRNGYALRNQVYNYLGVNLIDEMRDLDLYLIQEFIQTCPNAIDLIISCFNLEAYLLGGDSLNSSIRADALIQARFGQLDQLLSLFVNLLSSDIAEQLDIATMVRRSLIHFLFLAPSSNSELLKRLPGKFSEHADVKDILFSVSVQRNKRSSVGDKMIFHLKPEIASEIDIFYTYFSYTERQSCFDILAQDRTKSSLFPKDLTFNSNSLECLIRSASFFAFLLNCLLSLKEENNSVFIVLQILYIIHCGFQFVQRQQNASLCHEFASFLINNSPTVEACEDGHYTSIYDALKSLSSMAPYSCIQPTLKFVLSEIDDLQGKSDVDVDVSATPIDQKKEQAAERRRMLLERMQSAQNSFIQKCEVSNREEEAPIEYASNDNAYDFEDASSSDSYFANEEDTEEENALDDIDLWDADTDGIEMVEQPDDVYETFSPSSNNDVDKYIDPFKFLQQFESARHKFQSLNKHRQVYSFDLKKAANVEQQELCQDLGNCNICREPLCLADTSKIIGIIARLFKKRFLREYSEKHTRGFPNDQSFDLLFQSSEKKYDSWAYSNFSSLFSSCKHLFHYSCMKTLSGGKQFRCPLCRKKGHIFLPYFDRSSIIPAPLKQRQPGPSSDVRAGPSFLKDSIFLSADSLDQVQFPFFMATAQSICDRWNHYYGKYYLHHSDPDSLPRILDNEGLSIMQQYMARYLVTDVREGRSKLLFIEQTCNVLCDIIATVEIYLRTHQLDFSQWSAQLETPSNLMLEFSPYFFSVIEIYKVFITASTLLRSNCGSSEYESLKESMSQVLNIFTSFDEHSSFLKDLLAYSILYYSPDSLEDLKKFRHLVAFLFVKYYFVQHSSVISLTTFSSSLKYYFFLVYLRSALVLESMFFGTKQEIDNFGSTLEEFSFLYTSVYKIDLLWISIDSFLLSLDGNRNDCMLNFDTVQVIIDMKEYFLPISSDASLAIPPLPYPFRYSFVPFPPKFDQLIIQSTRRTCTKCNTVPSETAICFICGKLCCFKSTCCFIFRQMGECNFHMMGYPIFPFSLIFRYCCGSIGLFMLVQKAGTVYLSDASAYIRESAYVDAYGEPDLGFKFEGIVN